MIGKKPFVTFLNVSNRVDPNRKNQTYSDIDEEKNNGNGMTSPKSTSASGSGSGSLKKSEKKSVKRYNNKKIYGVKEWRKILQNNDLENTSTSEFYFSLKYGIPNEL